MNSNRYDVLLPVARCSAIRLLAVLVICLTIAGCGNQDAQRLIGQWKGHAEGSSQSDSSDKAKNEAAPESNPQLAGESYSLLSKYVFSITLNFVDSNTVRMSVSGGEDDLPPGSQSIEGKWRVIDAEKNRMTIQIQTPRQASQTSSQNEDSEAVEVSQPSTDNSEPESRRFIIRWEEGEPNRFTLSEENGAAHLGSLVFQRVKETE